ncbi:hypothetical protein D3C81_317930 [compost metagenome]
MTTKKAPAAAPLAAPPPRRTSTKGEPPASIRAESATAGNNTQRAAKGEVADFNMKMPADWKFMADLFIKQRRMTRKDYIRQLVEADMAAHGFTPGAWE